MSTASLPTKDTRRQKQNADQPPSPYHDRYLTIPNLICVVRVVGSIAMIWLAVAGKPVAFVLSFVVLSLSDWVDGKLARWLNQRSAFGARLDSASDGVLYLCLLVGCMILKGDVFVAERAWILTALGTYTLGMTFAFWKYGRASSYHTLSAKMSQWVVLGAALTLVLDLSVWPLRLAAICVTLTNVEQITLTLLLKRWHADVYTILHVLPATRRAFPRRTGS